MDMDDIDLSELEAETTRNLHKEAEMAEAASTAIETRAISKDYEGIHHFPPSTP